MAIHHIIHFGTGNFHRAHQAYAIQALNNLDGQTDKWVITGACILPGDKAFTDKMKAANNSYTLSMQGADGNTTLQKIMVYDEILFGPEDYAELIQKLAAQQVSVISMTITEGGYNRKESGEFDFENAAIRNDLIAGNAPQTVFGYLSRAFEIRNKYADDHIILLSCDNLQENGKVLKQSLTDFITEYNPELLKYIEQSVEFPNSMVDRITPITTKEDIDAFEKKHGYRDECLVQAEDYFQWVIEKPEKGIFPALDKIAGVEFTEDVRPYERMKLGILNGGHSLTGFTGRALGYNYIHESVKDERIDLLFSNYIYQEVIPQLEEIPGVEYKLYFNTVKKRFGNKLINDSVERIISDSTSKIPKFILPVINKQIETNGNYNIGAFIIACWWNYIYEMFLSGITDEIKDPLKIQWLEVLIKEKPLEEFLSYNSVFGSLSSSEEFKEKVINFSNLIRQTGMENAISVALKTYNKA